MWRICLYLVFQTAQHHREVFIFLTNFHNILFNRFYNYSPLFTICIHLLAIFSRSLATSYHGHFSQLCPLSADCRPPFIIFGHIPLYLATLSCSFIISFFPALLHILLPLLTFSPIYIVIGVYAFLVSAVIIASHIKLMAVITVPRVEGLVDHRSMPDV